MTSLYIFYLKPYFSDKGGIFYKIAHKSFFLLQPTQYSHSLSPTVQVYSMLFLSSNSHYLLALSHLALSQKKQQQQQSKRKLQILTQYNGLTLLKKSNMATPTTGLYQRSARPFQPSFKKIVEHLLLLQSIQTKKQSKYSDNLYDEQGVSCQYRYCV